MGYEYNEEPSSFALHGTCESDIDKDTDDEYDATLSALIQNPLCIEEEEEEEEEEKEVIIHTIEDPYSIEIGINEEEYSGDEESGDEETVNEGTPLIINSHNSNEVVSSGSGSNSSSIKSTNLP